SRSRPAAAAPWVPADRPPPPAFRYWLRMRMTSSSSVPPPPVMRHASHTPSRAPGLESQVASVAHDAPILPAVQATGWHRKPCGGTCEARVTVVGSGVPSAATPVLYSEQ